jgi:uncharacterized membrane protein
MNRRNFLRALKEELRKRRDIETEEVLFYYDELIQDAIDNGESEDVFIANLGSVKDIVRRLEDDKEFVSKVKSKNNDVVKDVLSKSVKIIGYFIFGVIGFSLAVTCISVFFSGVGIIFYAIGRALVNPPVETYGYLVLLGFVLVGISLTLLGVGVMKWFINQAKPALLTIFRNINDFVNKRGKE